MNPSPAATAAIAARVTDWSPTDAEIAATLNAPAVANPAPQGVVPVPFAALDLVEACGQANRANLAPMLAGSAAALILQQYAGPLGAGLDAMAGMGMLAPADVSAMKAVMARTVADPSWPPLVSWAQANLGRPVDAFDVAASRPKG